MHKSKIKMASRSKIRLGTTKLNENTGKRLFDINHSKFFFRLVSQSKRNESENKWNLIKLKSQGSHRGYKS